MLLVEASGSRHHPSPRRSRARRAAGYAAPERIDRDAHRAARGAVRAQGSVDVVPAAAKAIVEQACIDRRRQRERGVDEGRPGRPRRQIGAGWSVPRLERDGAGCHQSVSALLGRGVRDPAAQARRDGSVHQIGKPPLKLHPRISTARGSRDGAYTPGSRSSIAQGRQAAHEVHQATFEASWLG